MDINKMTVKVQSIIERAQSLSVEEKLQSIEIEAVIIAMLTIDDSMARDILERANIDVDPLIEKYKDKLAKHNSITGDNIEYCVYMSARFTKLYQAAEKEMTQMVDSCISQEHMVLGSLSSDSVMKETVGNKSEVIKEIIKKIRGVNHVTS